MATTTTNRTEQGPDTDVFHGALSYVLADVFTDRPLEGNQLAVFTDARGRSTELMRRLAREMRLSESARRS
jgi:trans-2,3-dihydro-3-hydroxyanthranilate isomerase